MKRWKDLAGVISTDNFTLDEVAKLTRVAHLAIRGFTYKQIAHHLGVTTHDQPHQQQQHQRSHQQPPPTAEPIDLGWSYHNPYG